jgi:hypothetical protein
MSDFLPHQESWILYEELGFNEPCYAVYSEHDHTRVYPQDSIREGKIIPAPIFQQAFKFFREEYQMVFCYEPCLKKDLTYIFFIYIETTGEKVFVVESKYNKEAELACIKKLIEFVKNKNKI